MFLLKVVRGPDQGKSLRLEPGQTYVVGCEPEASFRLTDPLVLKGHCSLAVEDGSVRVKNETASQPVYVGDKKIAEARLGANTAFRVGDSTLQIVAAPAPVAPKPARAPDALVGKIVGGYKLLEVVGEGGMGKVYRATQLSLHRDVALKVLKDQVAKDAAFRELFINEARAAAQLVHPNVVQVYDAGTDGDVSYFSMEFIGQGSVEEILQKEKKIPWEKASLRVLEAAHGLDYAEGKQIVHHDIKPDNLMLNSDGRIKIADLGLAKRGEGPRDKGIIGTPHFIPPEQALGKETDTRADIYSLGATFFRMITGRTLFSGQTAKEIVLKHIKEPPPAASSLEKAVPDELDLILARMLAKEPDQRYASAKELIAALETLCAHHGIKGSIIKKGVGKRVMIPLVLLLLAAGGVAYHFATKEPTNIVPPEVLAERERLEKLAREQAEDARRQEIARRQLETKDAFNEIYQAALALKAEFSVDSVYDDREKAPGREQLWLARATAYRDFAETEDAKEFGYAERALTEATSIEKGLTDAKEAQETKRAEIEKRVQEIKSLEKKQREKLADLRQQRNFEAAAILCEDVPWADILEWEWVNHINGNRQPATDIPAIRDAAKNAKDYFDREGKEVLAQAERDWNGIDQRFKTLRGEGAPFEGAPDEQLEAMIAELKEVQARYVDAKATDRKPKIRAYAIGDKDSAKAYQSEIEKVMKARHAERLEKDRVIVRHSQRRWCSLAAEQTPNWVMNCDIPAAIADWSKLLQTDQVKTDRYRRFADERIAMLRWTEYLFARFQTDLAESI